MRGAALADLHLGFRAFPATTDGRNAREVDTERAWFTAVTGICADRLGLDLVTIAGDCFHHPRVSDYAKRAFLEGLRRILVETEAVVVVLQGNHDAGRTSDVLTPIALAEVMALSADARTDAEERLHVVTEPQRIRFQTEIGEEASVACFPFVARNPDPAKYRLEPDPDADVNVLVMHAAVKGDGEGDTLPYFYGGDRALDVGREAGRWDVIACGDYHEFTRLHPEALAFYSGSLERTSSNIWAEAAPKGWVLWDTEAGTMELQEVPGRRMFDHTQDGSFGAAGVNAALDAALGAGEHDGAIVRLKVDDFPVEEREAIDWDAVREMKRWCLHFKLDVRYRARAASVLPDRRTREGGLSLAHEAQAFFADDDADVRDAALRYLDVEADVEDTLTPEEALP